METHALQAVMTRVSEDILSQKSSNHVQSAYESSHKECSHGVVERWSHGERSCPDIRCAQEEGHSRSLGYLEYFPKSAYL